MHCEAGRGESGRRVARPGMAMRGKARRHELGQIQPRCGPRPGPVQAERAACADLVWLESARHKAAEVEARDSGEDEEAEQHKWDAETLKRVAEAIEKRGVKA